MAAVAVLGGRPIRTKHSKCPSWAQRWLTGGIAGHEPGSARSPYRIGVPSLSLAWPWLPHRCPMDAVAAASVSHRCHCRAAANRNGGPSLLHPAPPAQLRRSALQCSGDQAAHVVTLERYVDDDARDHRDDRAREKQPEVDRAVGSCLHIAERDWQGEQVVIGQEAERAEEFGPGEQERVERCGGDPLMNSQAPDGFDAPAGMTKSSPPSKVL